VIRVFLDANVLFSAAYSPSGRAGALFRLAADGRCALVVSPHVIEEANRNLRVKAPDTTKKLHELLILVERTREAPPKLVVWAREKGLPDKDAPVLAAAVTTGADILTTGDRTHFGHLFGSTVGGVLVLSLGEALAAVIDAAVDS
jgi:predicted nucleic acid-binding protein